MKYFSYVFGITMLLILIVVGIMEMNTPAGTIKLTYEVCRNPILKEGSPTTEVLDEPSNVAFIEGFIDCDGRTIEYYDFKQDGNWVFYKIKFDDSKSVLGNKDGWGWVRLYSGK